jgi:outer membrane protein OmpA-like peptidoglycan-associated protein
MRKLILTTVLMFSATVSAQGIFPSQPVEMKPGYGAEGAGLHMGVPYGLPGNDCVINPVSMTRMTVAETRTVTEMVPGDIISIPANVLFDFDKDFVRPEGKNVLAERIYAKLVEFGVESVDVVGHTDSKGTDEYNMALGQRRADAVASELVALGFPSDAVVARSGGERYPLAANENEDGSDNPEGRQTNRRVSLIVNTVSDKLVYKEVVDNVVVGRNPQIFHRLSSDASVTCSSNRQGLYGPNFYRYNW